MEVVPFDEHNQLLVENAHPANWKNPEPAKRYNMVAIGGGTAGMISALGTTGLGGRAALVEHHLLGGDCLNYGCVPSKALIRAARAAYDVAHADQFGCRIEGQTSVDFSFVMERMRKLRARISNHDSAERFSSLGADVFLGEARFTSNDTLEVAGKSLKFSSAVIATGGRAAVPSVPGLEEAGYLTNETVFSLTELPARLIIIGAGPIGAELAQCFCRFGSEVQMVNRSDRFLHKEDPLAAQIVREQLQSEGVEMYLGWQTIRVETADGQKHVVVSRDGEERTVSADQILVAVGRTPNIESLNLEAAGVTASSRGIDVDDRLQTSNPRIYAAGDCCSKYQFTHAADAMARIVVRNAFFPGSQKLSSLVIPRCTYTDPELAHVGLTAAEAAGQGIEIDSYREDLAHVDRAIVDGDDAGFAVVHVRRGTGQIVGATIVARHAGEMIGEITLLLTQKLSLGALASTIHCYPTQVEVLKRIADAYSRTRLTPGRGKLLAKWMAWKR